LSDPAIYRTFSWDASSAPPLSDEEKFAARKKT
jgi:hypothetical protein